MAKPAPKTTTKIPPQKKATNEFPDANQDYISAKDFQDNPMTLTYQGFEYVANEDDGEDSKKKEKLTWKQKLKYILKYTYPKIATDEAGDQILGDDGKPFENKYWLEEYPHGYSVRYYFEEGDMDSGSLPFFKCMCRMKPKAGEKLTITRTGEMLETKWSVKRAGRGVQEEHVPTINVDGEEVDCAPDSDVPF